MANAQARWLASLSDGSIAVEGKTPFEEEPGKPSPWQKLILHLARNKLHITGLRIQTVKEKYNVERKQFELQPAHTYNLPSMSKNQKWANLKPEIPRFFNYFRRVERDMGAYNDHGNIGLTGETSEKHFIEIHAYYEKYELVLIVDEDEGNECWTLVKPI